MANSLPQRPSIRSAHEYGRYIIGAFTLVFYDQIVAFDLVQYEYVAALFAKDDGDPILYFTSEKNRTPIPSEGRAGTLANITGAAPTDPSTGGLSNKA